MVLPGSERILINSKYQVLMTKHTVNTWLKFLPSRGAIFFLSSDLGAAYGLD